MIGWPRSIVCCAPLKRLQLHTLDIELDHIDTRQSERVERDLLDCDSLCGRIVDRLADEFSIHAGFSLRSPKLEG